MRCSRCGTVPEDLWRWCPDCGGQFTEDRVGLVGGLESFCVDWARHEPKCVSPFGRGEFDGLTPACLTRKNLSLTDEGEDLWPYHRGAIGVTLAP